MIPSWPPNLLPRPFANNGNSALIPDDKPGDGRASWKEGFPVETQLPLTNGGIAPSRIDFNGIFQMLSALAFWQQSGGQAVYNTALNYVVPNVVFHEGRLWWCLQPNGPETVSPGVVVPGTDEEIWQDFWAFLSGSSSGGGGGGGGGTTAAAGYLTEFKSFYEQTPPEGWAVRNGDVLASADVSYPALWEALQLPANSWKLKTETAWQALVRTAGGKGGAPFFVLDTTARTIRLPDTRGDYVRDAGGGTMPNVGGWHGDAIREIAGVTGLSGYPDAAMSGAFYAFTPTGSYQASRYNGGNQKLGFKASRVVPTAAEVRPRSIGLLGCVYIGVAAS